MKNKLKKCFMCQKLVENDLLEKDNNYFCNNDCESLYYERYAYAV